MQPQDVFRQLFDAATARIETWADGQRDAADVGYERSASFWRVGLVPHAANACPVELILHRNQTYDIMIASESFEGLPLPSLDMLEPVLDAITRGQVVTIETRSATTGLLLSVATEVAAGRGDGGAAGAMWRQARLVDHKGVEESGTAPVTKRSRHYVPYRRT